MKYIKFLKRLEDKDTELILNMGDELPIDHTGISDDIGLYYCIIVNEQKYYLPENYNNSQLEIVRGEEN
jgi:hypothetical protein